MSDHCIAVISGAQARFFTLEPIEFPEVESGPRLIERGELDNPEGRIQERDLYADSKTGRGRAPGGGPSHGYDDHRSQHDEEFERRFGREALEKAAQVARRSKARQVLLVAPSRMLGVLRQELDILLRQGMEVREVSKDMIKFTPKQIHSHLAKQGLLPPTIPPKGRRGAR